MEAQAIVSDLNKLVKIVGKPDYFFYLCLCTIETWKPLLLFICYRLVKWMFPSLCYNFKYSNMLKRNKILFPLLTIISVILLCSFLYYYGQYTSCQKASSFYGESVNNTDEQQSTITYTDHLNNYSFAAPANLDITKFDDGVSIGIKDGPGITVEVYSKERYADKEDWLKEMNNKLIASQYIADTDIIVAGRSAITAHEVSSSEEYYSSQVILFETDDKIFVIKTPQEHLKLITDSFEVN